MESTLLGYEFLK